MANKKYSEFPAGAYDPAKILLQADPVTGALQKIEMASMLNQRFGLEDNVNAEDRTFNTDANALTIAKANTDESVSLGFIDLGGSPAMLLTGTNPTGDNPVIFITSSELGMGNQNSDDQTTTRLTLNTDDVSLGSQDNATQQEGAIAMSPIGIYCYVADNVAGKEGKLTIENDFASLRITDGTNATRLTFTSTSVGLEGLQPYANNAAAIAAGLSTDQLYIQNGLIAIVI